MAVRKKQSKFKKFIQEKGKWAIISTIIFLVVGITSLIVGFGLQIGWVAVLQWFSSKWAIIMYIALALLGFVLIWVIHQSKMKE
jgi:uncharacterized membrane protein (DUF485 family)